MTNEQALEVAREVVAGKTRSYVQAARDLSAYIIRLDLERQAEAARREAAARANDHDELDEPT